MARRGEAGRGNARVKKAGEGIFLRCFINAMLGDAGQGTVTQSNPRQITNNQTGVKMKTVNVTVEGVTPLICNKFHDAAQISASGGTRISTVGDRGTPREQAELKLYTGNDGGLIIPQPNLYRCLIDGGIFFKSGKSKITTQKSSLIPSCVNLNPLEIPLISKEGWCVDTRAVRIPSTGGRILAHRPIFNDWQLSFEIEVDTDLIAIKLIREILDASGKRIGLGDFRPACKGPYGKFVVVGWKEV